MNEDDAKHPFIMRHFGKAAFSLAVFYICYTFSREFYPDSLVTMVIEEVGFILFAGFAFLFVGGWVVFIVPMLFGLIDEDALVPYMVSGSILMPIVMFFFPF